MEQRDVDYIIMAHRDYPTTGHKAFRKWDGKTPYYTHPLWCASMIATETRLEEEIRNVGCKVLLYHDVLEDTTLLLPDWLSVEVQQLIHEMTYPGGFSQEIEQIWHKSNQVKLYKLYDKVSNLLDGSWMSEGKRGEYQRYTQALKLDVESSYGMLNITRIAGCVL